jgi:hypothetical protein
MDTSTLVEKLLDDGKTLIEMLPQKGFPVTAAFWVKPAENGEWLFYIASPVVEEQGGLSGAYRKLHPLIRQMPQPFWIDPLEVKLIGPNNPVAKDVLNIHHRSPGPAVCPIRWAGTKLGNITVEGVYLYPIDASTAAR